MTVNRKVTGTISTMPGGLAMGWGVSLAATLVGSALTAWLISGEKMAQTSVGYASLIILLMSAVLGAAVSWGRIRHRRMLVCLLSGTIYFLTLLCVTALFFGGQYQGIGVTALAVLGGSLGYGLLGLRGKKSGYSRRRKIR